MGKNLVLAALLLLVGGLAGFAAARRAEDAHRHPRAVMTLARFHLEKLREAAGARQCAAVQRERDSLLHVYAEMLQAYPLAYAQDAGFRQHADALKLAAEGGDAQCADADRGVHAVMAACDQCHREYR